MTKETAIALLNNLRAFSEDDDEPAIDMAIEALRNCSEKPNGSDLISRQNAVSEIHRYFFKEIEKTPRATDEDGYEVYTDMPTVNSLLACNKELSKKIKSLPSADAVEVVRCKDCRHSRIEGDTTLFMWCGYWNKPTDGNRYCSDGERREP